jgi:hydrogenase expression/formation protein HypE
LAAILQEAASASRVGISIDERALPVRPAVHAACEFLGLDPLHVANEGKLAAVVAAASVDRLLAVMHGHPLGRDAARIGRVTDGPAGVLMCVTSIGATRVVPRQLGEQLPRIC